MFEPSEAVPRSAGTAPREEVDLSRDAGVDCLEPLSNSLQRNGTAAEVLPSGKILEQAKHRCFVVALSHVLESPDELGSKAVLISRCAVVAEPLATKRGEQL